jgi:hypothetical protein
MQEGCHVGVPTTDKNKVLLHKDLLHRSLFSNSSRFPQKSILWPNEIVAVNYNLSSQAAHGSHFARIGSLRHGNSHMDSMPPAV